jgi:hypothetical protein
MNYHLTLVLIVFTTIIGNGNCNAGNVYQFRKKVQKVGGLKPENVPIFMDLVVKAFLGSPKCHQERKEENFKAENGKCRMTENGLKLLTEGKNLCKIQLQIGQLDKHKSLKSDLELLSKGKILWDGFMADWGHNSAKAIRGDLVADILNGLNKVNLIFILFFVDICDCEIGDEKKKNILSRIG